MASPAAGEKVLGPEGRTHIGGTKRAARSDPGAWANRTAETKRLGVGAPALARVLAQRAAGCGKETNG